MLENYRIFLGYRRQIHALVDLKHYIRQLVELGYLLVSRRRKKVILREYIYTFASELFKSHHFYSFIACFT